MTFEEQKAALKKELGKYRPNGNAVFKPVGITLVFPTYSDLTKDQLRYYLYWKSTVGTPRFTKAADGYTWLLVSELLNDPDHISASEDLNAICTSANADGSPMYPDLLRIAIIYSMVFGTPMPAYSDWMSEKMKEDFLGIAFSSPVSDVTPGFVLSMGGNKYMDKNPRKNGQGKMASLFGETLRKYDALLLQKTGMGLKETFLRPERKAFVPFDDYAYLGERIPIETVRWVGKNKAVNNLFALLGLLSSGRNPTEPAGLPFESDLIRIYRTSEPPKTPGTTDPFTKKDAFPFRPLGSPPTPLGPTLFDDPGTDYSLRKNTLGDILTFSATRSPGPTRFVLSGDQSPTYEELDEAQFDYYLYWRDSFLDSVYLDTDYGYLRLFMSELINTDRKDALDILLKLRSVYGDPKYVIGLTVMGVELLSKGSFDDYRIYRDRYVVNTWIDRFVRGTGTVPLDATMLASMRTGWVNMSYSGEEPPLDLISPALQHLFAEICKGKDPDTVFDAEMYVIRERLFVGLDYLRREPVAKAVYVNYLGSRKFVRLVSKSVELLLDLLSAAEKGQTAKRSLMFQKFNCGKLLGADFDEWYGKRTRTAKADIELDRDAIKKAKAELDKVTELMTVPVGTVEETPVHIRSEHSMAEDPWSTLSGLLAPEEKAYLSALLNDPPEMSRILKKVHIPKGKMEDSINSKSMDTVGDVVISDGKAIDDYIENLRRII